MVEKKTEAGFGKRFLVWIVAFALWCLACELLFSATTGYTSGYSSGPEFFLTVFEIVTGWIIANRVEWKRYGKPNASR